MSKAVLPFAVMLALVSGPALAGHCPKDVGKIDNALSGKSSLSKAVQAKAKALRDSGDQLHKSGKHGDSLKALHDAMAMLKIKH
jgi:hypothetical protein